MPWCHLVLEIHTTNEYLAPLGFAQGYSCGTAPAWPIVGVTGLPRDENGLLTGVVKFFTSIQVYWVSVFPRSGDFWGGLENVGPHQFW